MGKKRYKDQNKIAQYIFDDYIYNREYIDNNELMKHLNILIENNLGIKISGTEDVMGKCISKYKLASKLMCKYNKSLKKFKRQMLDDEYGADHVTVDMDPEIVKMSSYGLDQGTYYAYLGNKKHDDYAILKVEFPDKEDPYIIHYDLYFIGYNYMKNKDKFFKEYDRYNKIQKKNKTEIILYSDRRPGKVVKFKSFDQMVIKNKENIIKYIDNWVKNIPEYYKYGMTPKLSILLYGDPGTGKSTFTKALAKYLGIDTILSVDPGYFSNTDKTQQLPHYFRDSNFVVSVDDIDCVCNSREDDNSKENSTTLAMLLEFLDNPPSFHFKAANGLYYPVSIIIASTNYYDKLDDAVKRYGRFDLKIEMNLFDEDQAEKMCKLYDLSLRDVYKDPIDKDFRISPSQLQAMCLENIDNSLKKN